MDAQRKKRLQLLGIMFVFLAPMVLAFGLRLANWQPDKLRNNGILVQPPQDISADPARPTVDASFGWKDSQYRWTLVLIPHPQCADACLQRLADAEKIWSLMTQKATRLRLAAVGVEASAERRARLPRMEFVRSDAAPLIALRPQLADQVAAAVVDPAGLLMLRYEPGYDPAGVRQDLARLIR
jgi:hypothetical protein